MDFKNTKIIINSKEESEKIQKILFEHGCSWNGSKEVKNWNVKHLFIDNFLNITYTSGDPAHFVSRPHTQITVDQILNPIKRLTFMEAVEEAEAGKKVRPIGAKDIYYTVVDNNLVCFHDNGVEHNNQYIRLNFEIKSYWEIIEEKKTLWDKMSTYCRDDKQVVLEKDFRKALSEISKYSAVCTKCGDLIKSEPYAWENHKCTKVAVRGNGKCKDCSLINMREILEKIVGVELVE